MEDATCKSRSRVLHTFLQLDIDLDIADNREPLSDKAFRDMRDQIVLFINGERHQLYYDDARITLADFLRRRKGLFGTKVVCNEGDCGACSVLVGRPDGDQQRLVYRTIDSCIVFLYQLDCTHVVTVEGLRCGEDLTPIQESMVQCHGSQCGFCTPGIVVAMHGMVESGGTLDDDSLRYGLSGNLCRCTGYQQIFDAGRAVEVESVHRMKDLYPSDPLLRDFKAFENEPIMIVGEHSIYIPRTIDQACEFRASHPHAVVVSGATDVGVIHNHRRLPNCDHLCLINVEDFDQIEVQDDVLSVGGGATWTQIEDAVQDLFPPYYEIITRFGSPQIRNSGTLAGNLATGSPIADAIPFHLVMNSDIHLVSIRGERVVSLNDFYTGYRQNVMADDELIVRTTTPLLVANEKLALYKISKRRDMDISTLTFALWIQSTGDIIQQARLAIGGVGPTVLRITAAEEYLVGQNFSIETFQQAGSIAKDQIAPWSDVRGSADFRFRLAENLLVKSYHEFSDTVSPVG